jgi:hypothetical protein
MHDRDTLRLRLGRRHPVRITLRHNGKMLLDGPADNLSVSGAGFYVRPNGEKFPLRGERYGTCRITLPDRQTVFCQANVVHGKFDAETGYTLLGIEFVGLETEDERRLQRFIQGAEMASRKLARLDELDRLPVAPRKRPFAASAARTNTGGPSSLKALTRTLLSMVSGLHTLPARTLMLWTGLLRRAKALWVPAKPAAAIPAVAGLPPALAALLAAKAIAGNQVAGNQVAGKPVAGKPVAGKPVVTMPVRPAPAPTKTAAATTASDGQPPGPLRRPERAA